MAGALTWRSQQKGEALVKSVAKKIKDKPKLRDLTPDQLEQLARVVVVESLKDDLRREADLAGIDYQADRKRFLERADLITEPDAW
jgi:hypothetical protein